MRITPVRGFEQHYFVSDTGLVFRRWPNGDMEQMTLYKTPTGYFAVRVSGGTEAGRLQIPVHRLVAHAYLAHRAGATHVNHIDADKGNNAAWNLEWVTPQENNAHAAAIGVGHPPRPVEAVDVNTGVRKTYDSLAAAERDGHAPKEIRRCLRGLARSHHGFRWYEGKQSPPPTK